MESTQIQHCKGACFCSGKCKKKDNLSLIKPNDKLEKPINYQVSNLNQTQIKPKSEDDLIQIDFIN